MNKNVKTDILKIYKGFEAYRMYNKLFNNNHKFTFYQIDESILLLYKYSDDYTNKEIRCKFIVTDSYKTSVYEKKYDNRYYKTILKLIS